MPQSILRLLFSLRNQKNRASERFARVIHGRVYHRLVRGILPERLPIQPLLLCTMALARPSRTWLPRQQVLLHATTVLLDIEVIPAVVDLVDVDAVVVVAILR